MFRIFRVVKWSKHVVKCGQNQKKITRKIPIASARQPRLFLCHIVTLIREIFKSFETIFSHIYGKKCTALNKE